MLAILILWYIFLPVHNVVHVLTGSGVCMEGCNIASNRLDEFENTNPPLRVHPGEPHTNISHKLGVPSGYQYFVHEKTVFHYCKTLRGDYVRCSNTAEMASTAFQYHFYRDIFKGYIVKNGLQCANRCKKTDESTKCKIVDWDMFDGEHQCSIHIENLFGKDYYQLGDGGIILGIGFHPIREVKSCYWTAGFKEGWAFGFENGCPQWSEPNLNYYGESCTDCRLSNRDLKCLSLSGAHIGQNTTCYMSLKIATGQLPTCKNWTEPTRTNRPSTSNYCKNHDIVVDGDVVTISNVLRETEGLTCGGDQTVRVITIMAKRILYIDEDISILRGAVRQFSKLILISNVIHVTRNIHFDLRGSDSDQDTDERADGGEGGTFMAIALEWQNPEFLTVDVSGGNGGCKIRPVYDETREIHNYTGEAFVKLELDPKLFFFKLIRDFQPIYNYRSYTLEFYLYQALKCDVATPGVPGKFGIYGTPSKNVQIIQGNGQLTECMCSLTEHENCVKVIYVTHQGWHGKLIAKDPPPPPDETYFYVIREWLSTLGATWSAEDLKKIGDLIERLQTDLGVDSPTMFYQEIKSLILSSRITPDKVELQRAASLNRRIALYHGNIDIPILSWDYAGALGHSRRVRGHDGLVFNISRYIRDRMDTLTGVVSREKKRIETIKKQADDYTITTNRKINDAEALMDLEVLPNIEEIRQHLTAKLSKFRSDINSIIKAQTGTIDELKDNVVKAKTSQVLGYVLNLLKVTAGVVNAHVVRTEPENEKVVKLFGIVIGVGISGTNFFARSFTDVALSHSRPRNFHSEVPPTILNNVQPYVDWLDRAQARLVRGLEALLQKYANDPELEEFLRFVNNWLQELQEIDLSRQYTRRRQFEIVERIGREVRELIEGSCNIPGNADPFAPKPTVPSGRSAEVLRTFNDILESIKDAANVGNEITQYEPEFADIEDTILALEKFEYDVAKALTPMALGLLDTWNPITGNLDATAVAAVDIFALNVEDAIDTLLELFSQNLPTFDVGAAIEALYQRIKEALSIIAILFGRIIALKDEKKFAELFPGLENARWVDNRQSILRDHLDKAISEAIVFVEVDKGLKAARQWSFPFANLFIKELSPPLFNIENGRPSLFREAGTTLYNLHTNIAEKYTLLDTGTEYLSNGEFFRDPSASSDPFFTWEYDEYKSSILKLLEAKEFVHFFADVDSSMKGTMNEGREAIKFRTIAFTFHVRDNPAKQERLQESLNRCDLVAVHMGYSHYKFRGKKYLFPGDRRRFSNTTRGGDDGSANYALLTPVLSPYGMWKFQIIPKESDDNVDGLRLTPSDIVDLDLVGTGKFVDFRKGEGDDNPNLENLDVDTYYREYEIE